MLTIIRGLPGSGKSTLARKMAAECKALFLEPDMLMYQDGVYRYTARQFRRAADTCRLMIARYFRSNPKAHAIYADVLPLRADVKNLIWFTDAQAFEVIDMPRISVEESRRRNEHAVRLKDIQNFDRLWEEWNQEGEKNELEKI